MDINIRMMKTILFRLRPFTLLLVAATGVFLARPVLASPDIQNWETSKGAKVYYVHAPELPIIDVRVVFNAGSARDGDKPGLSSMVNRMLELGADKLNADDIAIRMESVGAILGSGSLRDMAWLSLRSLSDPAQLDKAVETMKLVLTKPSFPDKDLERERKRMLVALELQKQSPSDIASTVYYKAVYGDHPYASGPEGTEEGVKSLQRADLVDFYKQYYVARNAVVAIVGNLDRKDAAALAEKLTGDLAAGKEAAALPKVKDLVAPRVIRIKHPSSQTHVLIGQPGMYRGDPDYFTLYVGNHALGGSGLVSRLSDEVREKRGLSYSVYSYFSPMGRKGPFTMGLQTRNEQADEAINVLRKTLGKYLDEGMTAEEIESSKKNITGGFALRVDSNKKIVEYLAMIGFYKLPLDYLDKFNQRVEAVTLKNVHETMRRRLQPDRMVTVIVGGE